MTSSTDEPRPEVAVSSTGVMPTNIDEVYRLATAFAKSRLVPKGLDTPEKVMVAILKGLDVGFTPTQAIQEVHVINGKAGFSGRAILALIRRSGVVDPGFGFKIEIAEGDLPADLAAVVTSKRRDEPTPNETRFSLAEAQRQGLVRSEVWKKFPDRMLRWRAIQLHADLYYSDVTVGNRAAEILEDYPAETPNVAAIVKDLNPQPTSAADDPALIELGIVELPEGPADTVGPASTADLTGAAGPAELFTEDPDNV